MPSSGLPLTGEARHPWTILTGRRGCRNPPTIADVRDGMAIVPRQTEISVGTAYCGLDIPWKRGGTGLYCYHSPSHPPDEGMGFVGALGRLPVAGFSGSHQAGVSRS